MSQQQSYSEYFYFTITQDSEQDVQQIIEQYHFDRMCGYEAWNKGQISDDGTHQFHQWKVIKLSTTYSVEPIFWSGV